eukprot:GHVS01049910.1.p1 GENE.GHVS01049910.1~~GHVS01049910.1.p1  ORF type:complete len:244 (+),score=39.01 GHVS01049910.1:133-864(+)
MFSLPPPRCSSCTLSCRVLFAALLGLLVVLLAHPTQAFNGSTGSDSSRETTNRRSNTDLPEVTIDGSILKISAAEVARTVVSLNGGRYEAIPNKDGKFSINSVPVGSYLLTVVHPILVFQPLLVEVGLRHPVMKISVSLYSVEHGKGASSPYPLMLLPVGQQTYFTRREEFNLLALVKNPMMLIGLVCMGLMVLLPKLQNTLDPEALNEMTQAGGALGGGMAASDGAYVSPFVRAITTNRQTR